MKCSRCVELGLRSTIRADLTPASWAICHPLPDHYYDEDGIKHEHDHWASYWICSNGHSIAVQNINECPSCDWGKKQ